MKEVWRTGETFEARDMAATMEIDGKLITSYFDFVYRAIRDDQGNIYCILHTATDVSDRIAAWKMVAVKERRELLFNSELAALNEEYMATNEELNATNEKQQRLNEQLEALNEEYQATNEDLHAANEELGRLNSEHGHINENLSRINNELQNANGELTRSKRELGEINERLNVAILAGQMGSYDLDLSSGMMECSDQCLRNFGRSTSERFDLKDLYTSILPGYLPEVRKLIQEAIATNELYSAEYQIKLPDGSLRWIHASGSPRYDEQGKPVRMVGVTQDITDRKAYEQRRDDFLSVATHELKTPITVLKANLQLLHRVKSHIADPTAIQLIDSANRSMDKFSAMVDELLDLSRHQQGKLELKQQHFNLRTLLETCCGHVRLNGNHELLVSAPEITVYADEHRIEQVLVNLVNNAVKYAPDSREIFLGAEISGTEVKVSVRDTGKGIPQDQLPRLFDRFWQADSKSSTYSGLGMGLYICAEIVQRHGGRIWAESEEGKGTVFYFTLPL